MSRHVNRMCRRVERRPAPLSARSPLSNFPYSPPSPPTRQVLADMVMFYASAQVRDRIRIGFPEDAELLSDLVDEALALMETWRPTTDWHAMSVVRTGRTVEWLVWQTVTAADEELGPMYRSDPIMPFAIDLETLPRYPLLPAMHVHPDDID